MYREISNNWIEEMIERESMPQAIRKETVEQFAKRNDISVATYYYQSYKKENQEKILETTLNTAKKEVPEVLQVLIDNAKKGKEKSIEMYLDYILKLAKNLDLKSDGKAIQPITGFNYVRPDNTDNSTTSKTGQSLGETSR